MIKILYVCTQNSARSQMAEAWTRKLCGSAVEAQSAGIQPGALNPLAVQVMGEAGIDIASKSTQSVFELYRKGELFHYVITVCDAANAERCPIFPGITRRIAWSFADPAAFVGTREEQLAQTRVVRDEIRQKVEELCAEICPTS
jgi:arsenate reductase